MAVYVDTGGENVGDKLISISKITNAFIVNQNLPRVVEQIIIKIFSNIKWSRKILKCEKFEYFLVLSQTGTETTLISVT